MADCGAGMAVCETHGGEGSGQATTVNGISWSLTMPLNVRDGPVLAVTYSDVQGGTPGEGHTSQVIQRTYGVDCFTEAGVGPLGI